MELRFGLRVLLWGQRWYLVATADDFRRFSANCFTFAERVSDPADKARMIEMAQEFLELAWKQEQID